MLPSSLVLVAVLKAPRDLEIARVLGWYRIPLKHAPKTIAVDYVAFYQTAQFAEEKWAINYVAAVRGHELVTRAELLRTQPGHPRAQEMYYKIQLGPLERLTRPIPSLKWRRLTFLYTTGDKLLAATEINGLIVQSAERERLWKALYERGLQAEKQYQAAPKGELDLALLCALGNLGVLFGETTPPKQIKESAAWRYVSVTPAEVENDLPNVVTRIEQAVQDLGGLKR
jgi:hypothetical protein